MKVLLICGFFAEVNQEEIVNNTKGYAEFSANIFQKKLIHGFKNNKIDLEILSAPFIGAYPNRYKKMFFNGFEMQQSECKYVRFCNIWGYRNISRTAALKREIKRLVLKENKKFDLIVVYSAHSPFLEAAVYAKKMSSNSKICFIVPDLPQYMNLDVNKTKFYGFFKTFDIKHINSCIKYVDSFVILTEPMKNLLNIGNRPYMVVEGIIDSEISEKIIVGSCESNLKNIVYAGKLNIAFGIEELVDSFMKISEGNYRLVLCGDGDAKEYIKSKAKIDSRIMYMGQLAPEKVNKIIQNSTVLVNPRNNDCEYTKYSFPSKNIEYLMSGKPVVAYLLDGMPKQYENFIYDINLFSSLTEAIKTTADESNNERFLDFCSYAKENLLVENIVSKLLKL